MPEKDVSRRVLSAADILKAEDMRLEWIPVPEWGGEGAGLYMRPLSGFERDKFEGTFLTWKEKNRGTLDNYRAELLAMCMVNEDGSRLFTRQQVDSLGAKSALVIDRLFTKATELSGISKTDVEETVGN